MLFSLNNEEESLGLIETDLTEEKLESFIKSFQELHSGEKTLEALIEYIEEKGHSIERVFLEGELNLEGFQS